jgi:TRAP-type C4-dicarboxylate transport system permease small subunit
MSCYEKCIVEISSALYWVARFALFGMMLLTCCDVFLRYVFNRPIVGSYDLVALLGSVVIAFSIPQTTLNKGHVIMETLTVKLTAKTQKIFAVITGCIGIITFVILGWNLFVYGTILFRSGEVFPTLRMPIFYPAYAIACCCVLECLVLLQRVLQTLKGEATA